jgi:hypothetical protein
MYGVKHIIIKKQHTVSKYPCKSRTWADFLRWFQQWKTDMVIIITIIIVIIITAIELSLVGSSPYTSTDKTNKNKYT